MDMMNVKVTFRRFWNGITKMT